MNPNPDALFTERELHRKSPSVGLVSFKDDSITTKAGLTGAEHISALVERLPESHTPYTDKYFLRTREILEKDGLNPWVRAQIFIRKGPGEVFGVDEVLAILRKYSDIKGLKGRIFAKDEGDKYEGKEPLMFIEAPVQEIIELETMILGVLSAQTSKYNDGISQVNTNQVRERMAEVVKAAEGRPVIYAGARHWSFEQDAAIALAAHEGGAVAASTDVGAATFGAQGVGTIPHALEVVYAWKYGKQNAVKEATLAFDRHIDDRIKRVALVDFNNREIDDALATVRGFKEVGSTLYAVRVDTCGENVMQGGLTSLEGREAQAWRERGLPLPTAESADAKYWVGKGVTISGVIALRRALDDAGFKDTKIILSSGFGKKAKVEAFVRAEKMLGRELLDGGLLAGEVWDGGRIATMDLVAVGEDRYSLEPLSKVGRPYRPNPSLKRVEL